MKKDLTELVFILDRSGSMNGLEADTIGGFNAMIEKQKQTEGEALVSVLLFNQANTVLYDRVDVQHVPPMTRADYVTSGCTALIDALGDAIRHIGNVHKYAREEDRPEKTVFMITTDGMENASHRYTVDEIRAKIERQKQRYGWEFLFLGANIDAVETARRYGIEKERAVTYRSDSEGTRLNYDVLGETISCMRCHQTITPEWKQRIENDCFNRS